MQLSAEYLNWIDALTDSLRAVVLKHMKPMRARAGVMLCQRHEPAKGLYRIKSGSVRMFSLTPEGREFLYKIYLPPESFGDMACVDGLPYPLFAEALTDCELLFLPLENLNSLRKTHHDVETALLDYMARIARSSIMFVEQAATHPLNARVAGRLAFMAGSAPTRGETVTELKIAQKDIGVMVGASRQAINKVLAAFQAQGLIKTQYGAIAILDLKGLTRIAVQAPPRKPK